MSSVAQRKVAFAPVESLVKVIRDQKVMLDSDLAQLYGVETKVLNQAVKRNHQRFPDDFMFQLTEDERQSLRSHIVTLEKGRGKYSKYMPLAFTELGIAMLSSVLRSPRAIQANIMIMRAFVHMRELVATNKELAVRVEKLENNHDRTESILEILVEDIEKLSKEIDWIKNPPLKPKHRMGFYVEKDSET